MKLITTSSNDGYIAEKANFLRGKGILTSISNENTHRLNFSIRGELGLWVVINDQYRDALECLKNPNHVVQEPLSVEQMQELESSASEEMGLIVDAIANKVALFLVVSVIIGFLIYVFIVTHN